MEEKNIKNDSTAVNGPNRPINQQLPLKKNSPKIWLGAGVAALVLIAGGVAVFSSNNGSLFTGALQSVNNSRDPIVVDTSTSQRDKAIPSAKTNLEDFNSNDARSTGSSAPSLMENSQAPAVNATPVAINTNAGRTIGSSAPSLMESGQTTSINTSAETSNLNATPSLAETSTAQSPAKSNLEDIKNNHNQPIATQVPLQDTLKQNNVVPPSTPLEILAMDAAINSVTISIKDKDGLGIGEQYGANCYVKGNKIDLQMAFSANPTVTVNKLKSNTDYVCQVGISEGLNLTTNYKRTSSDSSIKTLFDSQAAALKAAQDAEAAAILAAKISADDAAAAQQKEKDLQDQLADLKEQIAKQYNASGEIDPDLAQQIKDVQASLNALKTTTSTTSTTAVADACQIAGDSNYQLVCKKGIITEYRPNDYIKRYEEALVLARLAQKGLNVNILGNSKLLNFKDENSFNYAEWKTELYTALRTFGILNGYADGSLQPGNRITYAEHYRALYNLYLTLRKINKYSRQDLQDAVALLQASNPNFTLNSDNQWYVEGLQFALENHLDVVASKDLFISIKRGQVTNDIATLL